MRSHNSKASGCPLSHGKADGWLQETQRKRRWHQRKGTVSHMVVMAIAHLADGMEPMEMDPLKDQDEPVELDPPLA